MKLTTFLRRFVNGRCPSRKLPATLELTGMRRSMRRLWNASIQHIESGVVLEHAATLVCDAEGKVELVHPVSGTPDEVVPNYDSDAGEIFIGTFHTHPYENGLTGMAFSGEDIASAINEAEWISLVQSGNDIFALIRTDKTVSQIDSYVVVERVNRLYNSLLRRQLSAPDALWIANLHICRTCGLAFYAGKMSEKLEVIFQP